MIKIECLKHLYAFFNFFTVKKYGLNKHGFIIRTSILLNFGMRYARIKIWILAYDSDTYQWQILGATNISYSERPWIMCHYVSILDLLLRLCSMNYYIIWIIFFFLSFIGTRIGQLFEFFKIFAHFNLF